MATDNEDRSSETVKSGHKSLSSSDLLVIAICGEFVTSDWCDSEDEDGLFWLDGLGE